MMWPSKNNLTLPKKLGQNIASFLAKKYIFSIDLTKIIRANKFLKKLKKNFTIARPVEPASLKKNRAHQLCSTPKRCWERARAPNVVDFACKYIY